MKKGNYPIILSHETRTGVMTIPNRRMGGRDVVIVGLNKEIPSGERYDAKDIEWIKAVLHFFDIRTLEITVDCMTKELKRWKKEQRRKEKPE